MRGFTVGRGRGYAFDVEQSGWVRAADAPGGVQVIAGREDLRGGVAPSEEWSATDEATGNNTRISDGDELYAGVGFEDLVDGQVDDVLWALSEKRSATGRLLELGCGPGFLLDALGTALPGWSLVGVDPSPVSVEQAARRGVDVRRGTLDTAQLEPGFDAVVVMGNFQLHRDPVATLKALADVTAPGGVLFLDAKNPRCSARVIAKEVTRLPGVRNLSVVHAFAAHAWHGMRHGIPACELERILRETGWEPMAVRTMAPRLLRFDNQHELSRGAKGAMWRGLDRLDRVTGERAWIQVAARRVCT